MTADSTSSRAGHVAALFLAVAALALQARAAPLTPRRIVTLAPACAEIVAALGLEGAIVGVTDYTDWPARVKTLPNVGSYVKINVEAVLALRPDLVVATYDGNPAAAVHRLEHAGIRVVTLNLHGVAEIEQSILSLGAATGRTAAAKKTVGEMRRVTSCVAARTRGVPHPRVLFAYQLEPVISAGQGTFTNELLALAGANSITADVAQSYPRLGRETVVARAPEVLIVATMTSAEELRLLQKALAKWPPIPAVRNHRVYPIDSTNVDRPSQRVVLGLHLLARTIHPALFAHGECAAALP